MIAFLDNPQLQQLYSESVVSPIAIGGIVCVCVFGGALVLQSALPLQGQALHMTINLGRTRLLLFENAGSPIPFLVLLVLVFWLTIIFASFGLFAPRNATVVAAFLVTALPVSGAIFFILELDRSMVSQKTKTNRNGKGMELPAFSKSSNRVRPKLMAM